jgi:hypothetical protein
MWVEKAESCEVHRPGRVGICRRVQGVSEPVGCQQIKTPVDDDCRQRGHAVEDALPDGPNVLLGGGAATRARCGVGGERQVMQMSVFGLVEV